MAYILTFQPSYQSDFLRLSRRHQEEVTKAVTQIKQYAENYHLGNVTKLAGYKNVWRYRVGDFRLVYSVAGRVVCLLAVGPRGKVYERFGIEGDIPNVELIEKVESALEPQRQVRYEYFTPDKADSELLPMELTHDLLNKWLIPEESHEALLRCQTEDDLLAVDVPQEHIERVLDCLWPQTGERVAQQPSYILLDPEDLLRYADGDLIGFLLKLDSEQEKLVDWSLRGPTLVKGGPGSGKSTVALYRASGLFSRTQHSQPRVLFTTFTTTLAKVSEQLLERLSGGRLPDTLTVTNIDKLVMKIASRKLAQNPDVVSVEEMQQTLNIARGNFEPPAQNSLQRVFLQKALENLDNKYLLEEFEWVIEGQMCTTVEEYLQAERIGRGFAFSEAVRRAVWSLYVLFRELIASTGKTTFSQLRMVALDAVRSGYWKTRYDYVLVDEAQDLSPSALSLCVELCESSAGLFLTADSSQSLYNKGFRWKKVHSDLKVSGRTRLLSRNYRSTQQISVAASELVSDGDVADLEALRQEFIHQGPRPQVAGFDSDEEQLDWIVRRIYVAARELRLPLGAAAILVPHNILAQKVAQVVTEKGLPACYMSSREVDVRCPQVKVLTMHAAKGLEFPIVAIPFLADSIIPGSMQASDESVADEELNAARRLLFVACTRAMRYLILAYPKSNPSRFLTSLTPSKWDWVTP